jgi:hypothetical protein
MTERTPGIMASEWRDGIRRDTLNKDWLIASQRARIAALEQALADLVERVDRLDLPGGLGEYNGGKPFALPNARKLLANRSRR